MIDRSPIEKIIRELWDFNASESGFDLRPSEFRQRLIQLGFTEAQLSEYYPWKPNKTETKSIPVPIRVAQPKPAKYW